MSKFQHLSTSSMNRLAREENFEDLSEDNDIVRLLKLVFKVHTIEKEGDIA